MLHVLCQLLVFTFQAESNCWHHVQQSRAHASLCQIAVGDDEQHAHLSKATQLFPGSVLQPVCGRVGDATSITQPPSQQEGPIIRVHKTLRAQQSSIVGPVCIAAQSLFDGSCCAGCCRARSSKLAVADALHVVGPVLMTLEDTKSYTDGFD